MVRPILIRCPYTGMHVQYSLPDKAEESDGHFLQFSCPACARIHLIDPRTGRLRGE